MPSGPATQPMVRPPNNSGDRPGIGIGIGIGIGTR